jgi:hypothetical protein
MMREAVQIGEAVKTASAKNIQNVAKTMLAVEAPKIVSSSCCGGSAKSEASETEATRCC